MRFFFVSSSLSCALIVFLFSYCPFWDCVVPFFRLLHIFQFCLPFLPFCHELSALVHLVRKIESSFGLLLPLVLAHSNFFLLEKRISLLLLFSQGPFPPLTLTIFSHCHSSPPPGSRRHARSGSTTKARRGLKFGEEKDINTSSRTPLQKAATDPTLHLLRRSSTVEGSPLTRRRITRRLSKILKNEEILFSPDPLLDSLGLSTSSSSLGTLSLIYL